MFSIESKRNHEIKRLNAKVQNQNQILQNQDSYIGDLQVLTEPAKRRAKEYANWEIEYQERQERALRRAEIEAREADAEAARFG